MKELKVQVNGLTKRVFAAKSGEKIWYHMDGDVHVWAPVSRKKKNRSSGATGAGDDVMAPMPGKITKVLVKVGDVVEIGQVVICMEAMKMEYNLKANVKGKVYKIPFAVGEQAMQDDLLVKIEPVVLAPAEEKK